MLYHRRRALRLEGTQRLQGNCPRCSEHRWHTVPGSEPSPQHNLSRTSFLLFSFRPLLDPAALDCSVQLFIPNLPVRFIATKQIKMPQYRVGMLPPPLFVYVRLKATRRESFRRAPVSVSLFEWSAAPIITIHPTQLPLPAPSHLLFSKSRYFILQTNSN